MKQKNTLFILVSLILASGTAWADDYHYTNILIGDRASGMAGAYTAVSDDPAGMYYNPAGIAYATGRSLSASVNAYHSSTKEYEGVIGGNGWKRQSSALLPNFFGIIQPLGKLKVGFSYSVPESILEDQDQIFTTKSDGTPLSTRLYDPSNTTNPLTADRYLINFNSQDHTNLFGPSLAGNITDSLSVGMTLYAHNRSLHYAFNQEVNLSNGGYELTNRYLETDEWGMKPVLGIMWTPMDKVSLGLSIAKTWLFSSNSRRQDTFVSDYRGAVAPDGNGGYAAVPGTPLSVNNPTIKENRDKREYPYQVSLGGAWFPTPELLLSADATYFNAVSFYNPEILATDSRKAVVNFAVGSEYYLSKTWAMRAGIYSSMANTAAINTGSANQPENIDLYGGSLTFSRFTRNTSISAGGSYNYGSGKAQIRGATEIQNVTYNSWTMFVTSSYSY